MLQAGNVFLKQHTEDSATFRIDRVRKNYKSIELEAIVTKRKKQEPHHASMTQTSTEEQSIRNPRERNFLDDAFKKDTTPGAAAARLGELGRGIHPKNSVGTKFTQTTPRGRAAREQHPQASPLLA